MSYLRMYIRAITVHLYWFFFVILISFLPILVQFYAPLQPYLLGLYHDLGAWDLFFVSMVGSIAVWSLMITQALLIDGAEARFLLAHNNAQQNSIKAFGKQPASELRILPLWVETLLNWPITWWQLLFYFVLAMPGLGTVIYYSQVGWPLRLVSAACGIALAFVFMFILTVPAFWAGETTIEVSRLSPLQRLWKDTKHRESGLLLRKIFSRLLQWLRMDYLLEDVTDKAGQQHTLIVSSHFLALVTVLILSILYFVVQRVIRPPSTLELSAVAHLLILITLLIWLIQLLQFHLSLLRIPTYLFLLILVIGFQQIRQSDYYFEISKLKQTPLARLNPVDVVAGSKQQQNLVVVTSTGGGILAAGWTTQALQKLITARPEIAKEIRLISAVSGGSVGTAFYIDALWKQLQAGQGCQPSPELLQTVHNNSIKSSLSAAAYGFSFIDFWTILFGGPVFAKTDRGQLLDQKWAFNATRNADTSSPLLSDFREGIRNGCIPAPILNTTVMENGRRLMITPIDFSAVSSKRAMTLSEYLFSHDLKNESFNYSDKLDMNLWTAARLSATFPYISPAVRADLRNTDLAKNPAVFLGHHFIDGGYHDNYGVASALDWLDVVLNERVKEKPTLQFKRVLIIQLRVSPTDDSRYARSSNGYMASFLGPLVGLLQIRNGAAYARNEVELERFIKAWRARLDNQVQIDTVILEPASDRASLLSTVPTVKPSSHEAPPLSWHLT